MDDAIGHRDGATDSYSNTHGCGEPYVGKSAVTQSNKLVRSWCFVHITDQEDVTGLRRSVFGQGEDHLVEEGVTGKLSLFPGTVLGYLANIPREVEDLVNDLVAKGIKL